MLSSKTQNRENKLELMYAQPKTKKERPGSVVESTHKSLTKQKMKQISDMIVQERIQRKKVEKELRDLMIKNPQYDGYWASNC